MVINTHNKRNASRGLWVFDNKNTLLLSAMIWMFILVMIIPQGFAYNVKGIPTSGDLLYQSIWLSLMLLSVVFVISRSGLVWLLLRELNPFLLIFIAFAFLSLFWSIDISLSVRRLFRLATFLLVGIAFVTSGWHPRRYQNVIRPLLTLILLGSIVFCLVSPRLAIEQGKEMELVDAWHGLATQKNGLGALACFGLIFWVHAWLTREVKSFWAIIGCGISLICLVKSRSDTSMGTTIVVLLLLYMMLRTPRHLQWVRPIAVSFLSIVILLYAIAILNLVPGLSFLLDPIVAITGKTLTFSGRTTIWAIVSKNIDLHPLLGTGYAAYWTPAPIPGRPSYVFLRAMEGFYPGETHNGYLDVINDLGYIGLVCLLGYIFVYIRRSLQLLKIDANQASLYMALFFEQAISNMTEAHWFNVLGVDFVFMLLATTALARSRLEYRFREVFVDPYKTSNDAREFLPGLPKPGVT